MAAEYKAQLLVVEAKLEREPDNEELQSLKENLLELIEISEDLGLDEAQEEEVKAKDKRKQQQQKGKQGNYNNNSKSSCDLKNDEQSDKTGPASGSRGPLSEAELLAKKKEKNRKKKAKLREKIKEQLDVAESEKQSWQSFANKKGLRGVTKRSIFASPCSVTGKVGVGTNGIADAPSASSEATGGSQSLLGNRKRRH